MANKDFGEILKGLLEIVHGNNVRDVRTVRPEDLFGDDEPSTELTERIDPLAHLADSVNEPQSELAGEEKELGELVKTVSKPRTFYSINSLPPEL